MEVKKSKKLSIRDFAKDNSGMRLKSIRLPRDLTLGGTKLHKKEYKPNINVMRNKSKEMKSANDFKEIHKHERSPVIVKDKLKERFIQSTGVFSEGINFNDGLKFQKNIQSMKKEQNKNVFPISTKETSNEDKKPPEDNAIKDLLNCYDSSGSDSDDKTDFKPVEWNMISESLKNDILVDDKLKCASNKILDYFNSTTKVSLWQLPSSFASNINFDASNTTKPKDIQLNDMIEGEIGRIFVRRSGKVEISMGDIKYHMEPSMLNSCSENIISINIGPEKSDMVVLGEIDCSFILSPDWSYLLC